MVCCVGHSERGVAVRAKQGINTTTKRHGAVQVRSITSSQTPLNTSSTWPRLSRPSGGFASGSGVLSSVEQA